MPASGVCGWQKGKRDFAGRLWKDKDQIMYHSIVVETLLLYLSHHPAAIATGIAPSWYSLLCLDLCSCALFRRRLPTCNEHHAFILRHFTQPVCTLHSFVACVLAAYIAVAFVLHIAPHRALCQRETPVTLPPLPALLPDSPPLHAARLLLRLIVSRPRALQPHPHYPAAQAL